MTPEEVARFVLVPLAAAHPATDVPLATAVTWAQALKKYGPDHALEATEECIATVTRFPSPSEWIGCWQRVARRHAFSTPLEFPHMPGFEAGLTDTAAAGIAAARDKLRKAARDTREAPEAQDDPTNPTEGATHACR